MAGETEKPELLHQMASLMNALPDVKHNFFSEGVTRLVAVEPDGNYVLTFHKTIRSLTATVWMIPGTYKG